jgi:hypothetical protein
MTFRRVLPADITEAQFQAAILDMARWFGWRTFHPRTIKSFTGHHLTAYQGEAGFPDLVLAHSKRGVLFAELKVKRNKLSAGQELWREVLEHAGAEYHLWRPEDWAAIETRLKGKTPT